MGKQTERRHRKHRINPIGRRAQAGVQRGIAEQAAQPEQVLPVVQKLSSPDPSDRAWAAACVSNLIMAGSSVRKLLLSKGVIPLLLERLNDMQYEVLEESLGALRNLAAVEPSVAREYYNRDILTALGALLPKITSTIDAVLKNAPLADEADQDRRRTIWDVAENFIHIVWSICEASDKYIKAVNRLNIITFLISFLSAADQCPTRVVVAAGQCLTTLTEDNRDIYIEFQNHPEYAQMLYDILGNSPSVLVRVLACAIIMNVREVIQMTETWDEGQEAAGSELVRKVLPILIASLEFNIQEAAEKSIEAAKSGNVDKHEETGEITPKPKQPLTAEEQYIQSVEERLSTLQLSLEILAEICVMDDDNEDDGWEDADEDMEDEDAEEPEVTEENVDEYLKDAAETLGHTTSTTVDDENVKSNPVLRALVLQVNPHLVRLATLTPLSFATDSVAPTITEALNATHQRALECFNNFLLAMNDIPSKFWFNEHLSDAHQAWRWLFDLANKVASTPQSKTRDELIEVIVGCLWSLGRGLVQNIPLEHSDVTSLIGAYQAASSESMRVKTVGCLGPIAMKQGAIEINKQIGDFFMQVLASVAQKQTSVEVAVEVLNCIYDVYSDCAFDYDEPVFVHGGYLQNLSQFLPHFRTMVKSVDRRKNFDLRSRADEAVANLVAFIKYKKNERQ